MTYAHLLVRTDGHITEITLNRPEVMNAINTAMHHELQAAFDAFAADPDQRVCIIAGAGDRAFCAGSDLKARVADGPAPYPRHGYAGLIERFDLDKPIIAAVNGVCLGGGFEIALACDLIIASHTATFGLPEPRVGAVALGGGLHRLARQVGLKRAMGLILSCERISVNQALDMGLVNEVTSPADLLPAARRWAAEILKAAPLSIAASKQAVMRGLDEPSLEAAIRNQETYPAFARWRAAEDTSEGPRAFAEKRPPVWKGR